MSTPLLVATLACAAAVSLAPAAAAQTYGGPPPRDGACFYRDANYRGRYFCVEADDALDSMPSGADDEISSIRIYGRVQVMVYRDRRLRGDMREFSRSIGNLVNEDFNDEISSLEVRAAYAGGRPPFGSPGYGRGRGRGSVSGREAEAIVRRAYQDILERDPDAEGMRTYRSRIIDDGWTEQQVREALRRSPEYREKNTMTRAKAEQIVAEAYRNVLRREPDPASRVYVERVLRDRWTRQDVERELRKSPEYRDKR